MWSLSLIGFRPLVYRRGWQDVFNGKATRMGVPSANLLELTRLLTSLIERFKNSPSSE